MNLVLGAEHQAFIDGLVKAGRFPSANEALSEAVRLLVSQERLQQEIQVGIRQADRGELCDHDMVFRHIRKLASQEAQNGP